MVGPRPRRSAVPVSYRLGFPKLPGSSGGEENESEGGSEVSEGESEADADTQEAAPRVEHAEKGKSLRHGQIGSSSRAPSLKRKRKRYKSSTALEDGDDLLESSSGSEYAPEAIKSQTGAVVEAAESVDSAEFDAGDLEEEEDDDDDGGGNDENLLGSVAGSHGYADNEGLKVSSRHDKGKAPAYSFIPSASTSRLSADQGASVMPAPLRVVGRTPQAILSAPQHRKPPSKRKSAPHETQSAKKTPVHNTAYGPAYDPPRFILARDFGDACHCPPDPRNPDNGNRPKGRGVRQADSLSTGEKLFAIKRAAYLPFGPRYDVCEDFGWYKGKYKAAEQDGHIVDVRSRRWGGWYDDVRTHLAQFEVVTDIECA